MFSRAMLDAVRKGRVTVSVDGTPLVLLDRDSKSLEVDASGLEKMDMKISDLFVADNTASGRARLKASLLVKKFAKNGWSFSLYDRVRGWSWQPGSPGLVRACASTLSR